MESELRFYSAFYVSYGLVVLRVAPRADRDTTTVRALAGALFLAGLARGATVATVAMPSVSPSGRVAGIAAAAGSEAGG